MPEFWDISIPERRRNFDAYADQQLIAGHKVIVEIVQQGPTPSQFRALHLWFRQIAQSLNDAGYSVMRVLRHDAEIPWTEALVKEHLWRPIQKAMTGKVSTKDPKKLEYPEISETLSRHLAQTLDGYEPPPWPEHRL